MSQEEFLNKFNPERSIDLALSRSINAAIQRNKIYLIATNSELKYEFKRFWSNQLLCLYELYKNEMCNEYIYLEEILALKKTVLKEYSSFINFKISHAQKSIGVFFKHLWCMGEIGIPPQCPIDRIILTRAKAPISLRSWGKVDDIQIHIKQIEILRIKATKKGFNTLAEWELATF